MGAVGKIDITLFTAASEGFGEAMTYSPLPWTEASKEILDADGRTVASVPELIDATVRTANVRLIVEAVNLLREIVLNVESTRFGHHLVDSQFIERAQLMFSTVKP